jgi:hypothetical protein
VASFQLALGSLEVPTRHPTPSLSIRCPAEATPLWVFLWVGGESCRKSKQLQCKLADSISAFAYMQSPASAIPLPIPPRQPPH